MRIFVRDVTICENVVCGSVHAISASRFQGFPVAMIQMQVRVEFIPNERNITRRVRLRDKALEFLDPDQA
jgi:hypothetical protein